MSTRLYPLFIKGNPQLRIFLPNFWMKLVKPNYPIKPNTVHFIVSMEMTKHDVKNYLEKIYNVPVVNVHTKVYTGEIRKEKLKGYLVKDEDYRMAFVTLPKDYKFEFPNLFPEEKKKEQKKDLEEFEKRKKEFQEQQEKQWDRQDVPNWFGL